MMKWTYFSAGTEGALSFYHYAFIAHSLETRVDSMKTDTVTLAVMKFAKHPTNTEKEKISAWLKARVGAKKLRLITE